jgi:SPP1 family predicted phage head-tail adaptor
MIPAGKLRHTITLQALTVSQDSYGGATEAWTTFATVRASVEPLQGREFFASQQVQAEVTTRFRIRYLAGVKPTMRVVFEGRTFDVQAVLDPNEMHRELHLMAVERVEEAEE